MCALSGFVSLITCSRLALPFGVRSFVHCFSSQSRDSCRLQTPQQRLFPRNLSRMAGISEDVEGPPDIEQGTKSGYTILVDYGKGEGFAQDVIGEEMKLFQALQHVDPERFPSSSSAKKTIRKGAVLVDGKPGRVDTKVSFGTHHLKLQHRTSTSFKPIGEAPFHVDILYEDHCLAVVHKPPGVTTHPMPELGMETPPAIAQALTWFVSTAPNGTPGALWKPMVIHRLDKPTEGLLMVVKTKAAWQSLQEQFTTRSISKRYLAVVLARPPVSHGTIDLAVDYKKAVSDWRVLSCFPRTTRPPKTSFSVPGEDTPPQPAAAPSPTSSISSSTQPREPHQKSQPGSADGFVSTLELVPHHGRTHQLRIHCAQGLAAPIVGDNRYGPSTIPQDEHGLLLAAVGLRFKHPETGEDVQVEMEEPGRFKRFREDHCDISRPVRIASPS